MPRSITGEQRLVASELLLKFDDVTPQGALTTSLVDALVFFLKASQLKDDAFDPEGEDAATARRIEERIQALVEERRRKDELIPVGDISNLTTFLFPWRMKADLYHDILFLREGDAFVNLIQRIQGLTPRTNGFQTITQQHEHVFRPTINRVSRNYIQTIREGDHQHIWAPETISKTFQSRRTVQEVHTEHSHHMTIKRVGSGNLTLGNPDDGPRGRIALYSNGVLIPGSEYQFLPSPLNHPQNLLSVSPGPNEVYFLNNPSAHSHLHPNNGGGGGGSADGVLQTLSIDTQAGSAGLGKITGILSSGVGVTTGQSTLDLHPSIDDHNALLASVASLQAQVAALSFQISIVQAALPKVRLNPGETPVPFRIISFDSGSMAEAYDAALEHVHVWTSATSLPIDSPT